MDVEFGLGSGLGWSSDELGRVSTMVPYILQHYSNATARIPETT